MTAAQHRTRPVLTWIGLFALAAGCGDARGRGLVVVAPAIPERPFFHDFGTLRHGTRTEHAVHLRNTDPEPVTILSADPACACTRARALRLVDGEGTLVEEGDLESRTGMLTVPPGGLVELVIGMNTASILPNQEKLAVMRVRTSSENTPFLTFEMHVLAEKLFTATPGEIRMGEIPTGSGGSARTNIMTGARDSLARIVEVLETTGAVTAELEEVFVNDEFVWGLTATFPPLLPLGPQHATIVLATTDAEGQGAGGRFEIAVWASVVPDVVVLPHNLHFGALAPGEGGTLEATLRALVPGARVKVLEAQVEGPRADLFAIDYEPQGYVDDQGRSDRWALRVTSSPEMASGRFAGTLRLRLDDEQTPEVVEEFAGYVR